MVKYSLSVVFCVGRAPRGGCTVNEWYVF